MSCPEDQKSIGVRADVVYSRAPVMGCPLENHRDHPPRQSQIGGSWVRENLRMRFLEALAG